MEEVIRKFPTDGMVCGVGSVNGAQFGPTAARAAVLAYDYTVLAGTQGPVNHPKTDRMLEIARAWRLPVVFFTEGGGGRAGTGGNRTGAPSSDDSNRWLAPGRSSRPRSRRWPGSTAWCPPSGSTRATASPATPPCSAPAT